MVRVLELLTIYQYPRLSNLQAWDRVSQMASLVQLNEVRIILFAEGHCVFRSARWRIVLLEREIVPAAQRILIHFQRFCIDW